MIGQLMSLSFKLVSFGIHFKKNKNLTLYINPLGLAVQTRTKYTRVTYIYIFTVREHIATVDFCLVVVNYSKNASSRYVFLCSLWHAHIMDNSLIANTAERDVNIPIRVYTQVFDLVDGIALSSMFSRWMSYTMRLYRFSFRFVYTEKKQQPQKQTAIQFSYGL